MRPSILAVSALMTGSNLVAASTRVSVTDLQKQLERQALENVRLSDELKGALDHQRASAEILKVISTGRPWTAAFAGYGACARIPPGPEGDQLCRRRECSD